jgi:chromosome segregation ATPase
MKATALAIFSAAIPVVHAVAANPVGKVVQLLSDMQSKIISEGEEAQKSYAKASEWCEERSKNLGFEIKTAKAQIESLKALIEEQTALGSSLTSKVESLAAGISTDEADLKAATDIRTKEATDFAAQEKELTEVVDTLQRAIGLLEREMQKGGASLMQVTGAKTIAQAMDVLVHASAINLADAKRLTALVQAQDTEDDTSFGAPAATVYESHSGNIVDTLENLLEKAEEQLGTARKQETSAAHNFGMLKQSLEDEIKFASKDMAAAKKGIAQSAEKKANAEGDLDVTTKSLKGDGGSLDDLHQTCMTKAQDFEAETKSRGEELKALADAKKVISETTGGATKLSYGLNQASFLQMSSSMDLASFEAVHYVRNLARKVKSRELEQLASRMASAMQIGADTADGPFDKVKGLIADMIKRLEAEAQSDASHKAYCDKELGESMAKKDDKTSTISKLSAKIDQMSSRSAQLKEEVAGLNKALADLAAATAEMDQMRQQEHKDFVKNKAEMQQGLEGIKMALKVLREYYALDKAHSAAEGAGSNVIGLLEVVESDFSKGLAEMTATEDTAQATYDTETKENEIEKTTKDADVAYKTKESAGLDKAVADTTSDRSGEQAELDAVNEYLSTLDKTCVERAETYSQRKERFEAEIAGLKEALRILESETVLLSS